LQRRIKDAQQWLLLLAGSGRSNQSMKQHIGKRVRPKQLYIQLVTATGTAPAGSVDQAVVQHTCYCLAALPCPGESEHSFVVGEAGILRQ
jgi:hypothetical protein